MPEWWNLSFSETADRLGTGHSGLSVEEARERLEKYGSNELVETARTSPLKIFLRQFVYLRPDLFVIYDRTESTGALERQWMLHSLEPADLKDNEALIANWNGRLSVKVLLPEGVSSRQYPKEAGRREDNYIAFTPAEPAERQAFLTVLYAMGKDTPSITSCERIEKQGMPGARVVIGETIYEVTFATSGPPAGHVSIKGPERAVDKDLAQEIVR